MSLGPIPNILASELFPTDARSSGVALSTSGQWVFNALVAAAFPALAATVGTPGAPCGFEPYPYPYPTPTPTLTLTLRWAAISATASRTAYCTPPTPQPQP